MAVRTLFGPNGRQLTENFPPQIAHPGFYGGRVRTINDAVGLPNPTNINSRIFLGRVPSQAVVLPASTIRFGAGGAGVTLDIGDANDPDGLATAIAIASAGSSPLLEAMAASAFARPLWQHLGYTADPGRPLDVYGTIGGANMAAANMFLQWDVYFAVD